MGLILQRLDKNDIFLDKKLIIEALSEISDKTKKYIKHQIDSGSNFYYISEKVKDVVVKELKNKTNKIKLQ